MLEYTHPRHANLPHIVKFSGGRSSGMMLFYLLENNLLNRERGDVILFNNTTAEHPNTYKFIADCRKRVLPYKIPFYLTEFQTYESLFRQRWSRISSYRLVNDQPRTTTNPNGLRWHGEAFEEIVSRKGTIPSLHRRICTQMLKMRVTQEFLRDWLTLNNTIPQLGCETTHLDPETEYAHHVQKGGATPKHIFMTKKQFHWQQTGLRPEQKYLDYDPNYLPFENRHIPYRAYGGKPMFGKGGLEFVSFIGLRHDEPRRVSKIEVRNRIPCGYEGEHALLPLNTLKTTRQSVNEYWEQQDFDLDLPASGHQSNCVYCFLKGVSTLQGIYQDLSLEPVADYGPLIGTPSDIQWWIDLEYKYRRDLKAENRHIKGDVEYVSFFGERTHTYEDLKGELNTGLFKNMPLPCDCTD